MDSIRHIAIQVPDPWLTAEYYKRIFVLDDAGETDSSLAEGVYLTDGVINLALLAFKSEYASQGAGLGHVGLHHFGVWAEDLDATTKRVEAAGAEWVMGEPDYRHNASYEVKYRERNGVIVDLVHNGWAGTQSRPGEPGNMVREPRSLVARFDDRRTAAAAKMDAILPPDTAATSGQLRHFAISTKDPWATAEFFKYAFGWEVVGETDSSIAEGTFMSDGLFNVALLNFKNEKGAQGKGVDYVGMHHFGIWVDEVEPTQKLIEQAGGEWIMGEPDYRHNAAYEVKFREINGVILDLVHNGWAGTQRRPGDADNMVTGPRTLVERYAGRRASAAQDLDEQVGRQPVPAE
jgi:catechol 2,3-dioxygenase-like lactoylglutathione lyase family enzyme